MERIIRYQGAIIDDGYILLVRHHGEGGYEWWNVPGGGRMEGEAEEECIIREIQEETGLRVKVERLLIDGPSHRHSPYQRFKTYLCTPIGGIIRPDGIETFNARWFDLNDASQTSLDILNNETTYVMIQRIRKALA